MNVPVNEPLLNGNEHVYLEECINSGWISSDGPFVSKFENKFAEIFERKYAIAVSNGTTALDIAFSSIGLAEGDEVIVPTFTIISCLNQLIRMGVTPIPIDCHLDTYNINTELIREKITLKTKAILVVHIYGLPVEMDRIIELAKEFNLKIIEDAAEMHGQTYKGKPCGSFGDISTFSFYANKHITTGEGGIILTDNETIAKSCSSLRNLCFNNESRFVHEQIGWNARMTNMQAAVGLAQLERLDKIVERKRQIGGIYNILLKDLKGVILPIQETEYAKNIYWVYSILLDDTLDIDSKLVMEELAKRGVGTRPFFYPMHLQPVFLKSGLFKNLKLENSEKLYKKGFYLPSGLALTKEQIEYSAEQLSQIINNL